MQFAKEYDNVLNAIREPEKFAKLKEEYDKKLEERIYTAKNVRAIRVADLVRDVNTTPEIQSDGGIFALGVIEKTRTVANSVFWGFLILGFYFAFTKLLMGLHNNKTVEDLAMTILLLGPIMSGICYWIKCKILNYVCALFHYFYYSFVLIYSLNLFV